MLWKERDRVDAAKNARAANHRACMQKTLSASETPAVLHTPGTAYNNGRSPVCIGGIVQGEVEDLWEEMEALEVGGASSGEEAGGGVGDMIQVERRH